MQLCPQHHIDSAQKEVEAVELKGHQAAQMGVRVITSVPGSGPFGESIQTAKFYTLDPHPQEMVLAAAPESLCATRTDVDVGPGVLAFVIDGILTRSEADVLVAVTETMGYSKFAPAIRTPPGMRQNKACHWLANTSTVEAFLEPMFARFSHLLPAKLDGTSLYPHLSHRFAHYKYDEGDVFNRHTDGSWPGQSVCEAGDGIEDWPGLESKLSMLLYLSDDEDGVQGGKTRLFPFGPGSPVDISPRKGSALFFRHGFGEDSVHHMGTEVIGSTPKYVLRLNVLYNSFRA